MYFFVNFNIFLLIFYKIACIIVFVRQYRTNANKEVYMIPYADPCPNCDGYVEADTHARVHVLNLEHAQPGDTLHCTFCDCWAHVNIRDGIKAADWDSPCTQCQDQSIQVMVAALLRHPRVKYVTINME